MKFINGNSKAIYFGFGGLTFKLYSIWELWEFKPVIVEVREMDSKAFIAHHQ